MFLTSAWVAAAREVTKMDREKKVKKHWLMRANAG